jgi:hypothetical protein
MTEESDNLDILRDNLQHHVAQLAGEIGERNVFRPEALHAATDYITGVWWGW